MTKPNIATSRIAAALLLSVALFVCAERAKADCSPSTSVATPANNTSVTCSTGTITANGANGYGTGTETGDTITVVNANNGPNINTTVTGTAAGIAIHDGTIEITGSGATPLARPPALP